MESGESKSYYGSCWQLPKGEGLFIYLRSECHVHTFQSWRRLVLFQSLSVFLLVGILAWPHQVVAEEVVHRASNAILEEVVVIARKREERAQDVPISISAFGSDQLDALKIRDLTDLSYSMPNVSLDQVGTTRGTANFSIRGLGINSSIVSVDPTVGVFIDGMYLGVNTGILYDAPDLASIEVLRGPQGVLFGRNVVGGAVLINTKKPSETFEAKVRTTYEQSNEGGDNKYLSARVSGPISDTLRAGLTVFFNDDDGPHENQFTGKDHSGIEQLMVRPAVVWNPTDKLELVARYEYLDTDAEGTATQSHTNVRGVDGTPINHDPDDFSFSIDEPGEQETEAHRFTLEANWDVGENGTITNIFGWREYEGFSRLDVDAQPLHFFHADEWNESEQFSNELRYNVLIDDRINFTTGVFYFENDILLHERRLLFGGAFTQDGGGDYQVESLGVFGAVDYDLSEKWTVSAGLRYTQEDKEVEVTSLTLNANNPCRVDQGTCSPDFVSEDDWDSWSPKVGVMYDFSESLRLYGNLSRGHRSGGYNLRNTAVDTVSNGPGPFDQEQVDSLEIGFKSEFSRGRFNGALFYNEGKDIQRVVLRPDPGPTGGAAIIKNTGDTEYFGVELDGVFSLTDNLVVTANVGYLDAEYSKVVFDINGDGAVDSIDKNLEFPRAPELTYSIGLLHDVQLGSWSMASRVSYSHRDESFFDDDNDGALPEQDIVNAGIDFYSNDGHWEIGVYAKNLTNEVSWGGEVPLPSSLGGGTFAPLTKPRRFGAELTYNFF